MIPKTLSASSLQVASLCMKRWEAEYINRVPSVGNSAAMTGTICHGALEKFVQLCYIDKTHAPEISLIEDLYKISYIENAGNGDFDTPEYRDGWDLVKKWFRRTSFDGFDVESVEVKDFIEVPALEASTGQKHILRLNFIIDRLDRTGETTWRIVDYKTNRVPIQPEELHSKIQARIYGLAVQIKHPEATEIRVNFDLLRHDQVGTKITREDNIATWQWLKDEAHRIVNTPHDPKPTLNLECGYCSVKASCELMRKNVHGGGIHSLNLDEVVGLKFKIEAQRKGQERLLEDLETIILQEAVRREELDFEAGGMDVSVVASRRRQIDASAVAKVIGPELFGTLGSITLGTIDDLLKDETLGVEQREELKKLITYKTGDPRSKIKPKSALV